MLKSSKVMANITNHLFVSKYQLYLPDETALRHEVQRIIEQEWAERRKNRGWACLSTFCGLHLKYLKYRWFFAFLLMFCNFVAKKVATQPPFYRIGRFVGWFRTKQGGKSLNTGNWTVFEIFSWISNTWNVYWCMFFNRIEWFALVVWWWESGISFSQLSDVATLDVIRTRAYFSWYAEQNGD